MSSSRPGLTSAFAVADDPPAGHVGLAGIAEGLIVAPPLGADRAVFARAEAWFVRSRSGAGSRTRSGAWARSGACIAATAAFARADRAVAGAVGDTGIGEGTPLVAPAGADRVIFPRADARIGPGAWPRTGPWSRFLNDDAGRQHQQARKRRRKTAQNGCKRHPSSSLPRAAILHARRGEYKARRDDMPGNANTLSAQTTPRTLLRHLVIGMYSCNKSICSGVY